jgi:hypothetical protein
MRWRARNKSEALRAAVEEFDKREFRRIRIVQFDPTTEAVDEDVLTAD